MIRLALLLPVLLAACGVDGPPVRPSEARAERQGTVVTIGGSVGVGIGGRL